MTYEQLQQIRIWLNLNKSQFARFLKVKQPMIVVWESGERLIPEYVGREIEFFQGLSQTKQQKYIKAALLPCSGSRTKIKG